MTRSVIWQEHEPALPPVDETVDHVRGSPAGRLILEYGDWPDECSNCLAGMGAHAVKHTVNCARKLGRSDANC